MKEGRAGLSREEKRAATGPSKSSLQEALGGLCTNCDRVDGCIYRGNRQYCEEYQCDAAQADAAQADAVQADAAQADAAQADAAQADAAQADAAQADDAYELDGCEEDGKKLAQEPVDEINFKGLCRNCDKRSECYFADDKVGVWHCSEYC